MSTSVSHRFDAQLGPAAIRFTGRADGDLGHGGRFVAVDEVDADVVARRVAVLDRPWSWLRQVHGDRVVVIREAGGGAGVEADGAVTVVPDAALVVLTADCAPVALSSPEGVIGAAHAGWKGLQAGILGRTADAMRSLGATRIEAALGPCIHPECYEFGEVDLSAMTDRFGKAVRGTTRDGRPALDVPAAVGVALDEVGVTLSFVEGTCTACAADRAFSYRARGETERQAMVVWLP